jgi:hypothetical protein
MFTAEQIAAVAHEANRAYCQTLGDNTQLPWAAAPEWQRKSAIDGVIFHITHADATPSASHECWLQEKEANGWKFGPVKDAEKKEHPCCVPFEALPPEQQAKDHLFRSIVRAFCDADRTLETPF